MVVYTIFLSPQLNQNKGSIISSFAYYCNIYYLCICLLNKPYKTHVINENKDCRKTFQSVITVYITVQPLNIYCIYTVFPGLQWLSKQLQTLHPETCPREIIICRNGSLGQNKPYALVLLVPDRLTVIKLPCYCKMGLIVWVYVIRGT